MKELVDGNLESVRPRNENVSMQGLGHVYVCLINTVPLNSSRIVFGRDHDPIRAKNLERTFPRNGTIGIRTPFHDPSPYVSMGSRHESSESTDGGWRNSSRRSPPNSGSRIRWTEP